MELDKALRLALIAFLEDKVTVTSWGISNIIINTTSLTFDVDAMKYKGTISVVVSNNSEYSVYIGKESCNNCSLGNLVNYIDSRIEVTPDYYADLRKWILQSNK